MDRKEFKVWAPDFSDAEDPEIVFDFTPQFAAEHWVEDQHGELDYPDEVEVHVKDPSGTVTMWIVSCEMVLQCNASEKKERV